jgi:hypothetical protein
MAERGQRDSKSKEDCRVERSGEGDPQDQPPPENPVRRA